MQSEHILSIENLSGEKITEYRNENPGASEITCLVPGNDESTATLLKEHGFRYSGIRDEGGSTKTVFKWFRSLSTKYEDMAAFFDRRAQDYERHMREIGPYEESLEKLVSNITATDDEITVIDLGCGTGAELKYLFRQAPNARIVCIDMSEGMLGKLRETYRDKNNQIETICESYTDYHFGEAGYDYVIACNTLHHLLVEDKAALYAKLNRVLKPGGLLLIDDYTVDPNEEQRLRAEYLNLLESGVLDRNKLYHIDLPLSHGSEKATLKAAGFTIVRFEGEKDVQIAAGC